MKKWRKSLLALVLVVAMLCPSVSPAVHAEELDDVTVTTEAATAEESITEEETTEEETTVEETTVEETNGEITTEVTEETSEEVFTEEETTSVPSMQAPLMAAPLPIAPLAEAAPDNVLNADHRPVGSTVFFDADNEKPSFNVVSYYDTYTEKLGNKVVNSQYNWNSALSIKSSTDGALYHDLILNKDVLSIDYETGHPVEYTAYNGGKKQSSDGTYTIVGWGGDFQSGASKDRLKITFAGVSESLSELRDMKIQLYNKDGSLGQKITIDKLKENGATKLNDYETAYEVALDSSTEYQGIKFLFENTSGQEDMAGTILVSNVEMRCNGNWVDFAPFDFNTDKWNYYHVQWEDGSPSILPFLRATENAGRSWFYDESRTGTTAGYNISKTDTWHLWTMSTSDANIVDGTVNDAANRQALQIKYRDDYGTGVGGGHRTHVIMSSTQPVAGEYLAITMKTIGDLGEASFSCVITMVQSL